MDDQRLSHAEAVLDSLAQLDEHVVAEGHRAVLGEAVRAAAILPANALAADEPDHGSREEMRSTLRYAGALLTRVVLTTRGLAVPSPTALLELVDTERRSRPPSWYDKHPLWGRVAYVIFLCGELAHVSDSVEADGLGALWTLEACLDFLVALDRDGDLDG